MSASASTEITVISLNDILPILGPVETRIEATKDLIATYDKLLSENDKQGIKRLLARSGKVAMDIDIPFLDQQWEVLTGKTSGKDLQFGKYWYRASTLQQLLEEEDQ